MAEALAFQKADDLGNPIKRLMAPPPGNLRKTTKQRANVTDVVASESSDGTDDDYEEREATSSPGSDASDIVIPSNAEVCLS
jgi:hypothetical protein